MFFFAFVFFFQRRQPANQGAISSILQMGRSKEKQSLGLHESWRFATHHPDVGVGRLLAKQRRNKPGDASSNLNLDHA